MGREERGKGEGRGGVDVYRFLRFLDSLWTLKLKSWEGMNINGRDVYLLSTISPVS